MKKKLIINTAACDISKVSAKTLEAYEEITVNTALLLSSPQARELLSGIRFTANMATAIDVIEGAVLSIQNGEYTIIAGEAPMPPVMLLVNGSLMVEPGAEEALSGYPFIQVNGRAVYPKSLSSALARMQVNGSIQVYPDGAMLLKEDTKIDGLFVLRAQDRLYYCFGTLWLTDPALDAEALAQKGARLHARKAIIAEELLLWILPLLNEDAQVVVVKKGYSYLQGDRRLDEDLVFEHGTRLFVDGDLEIPPASREALASLQGLQVAGKITLHESMREKMKRLKPMYESLFVYRGHLIYDVEDCRVDGDLLALHPEGITCYECVNLSVDKGLSPQQIQEKLRFVDCVNIHCAPEHKAAVNSVAEDVVNVETHSEQESKQESEQEREAHDEEQDPYTETINAATYVL